MLLLGIGGEPCTGKSTLVRSMLPELGKPAGFVFGTMRGAAYHFDSRPVYVLGLYPEGETFGGTDRLSMAVQPYFEMFLERMKDRDCAILFEGDRLFNGPSIRKVKQVAASSYHYQFAILTANSYEKERRHLARKDNQSASFIKSRATKLTNLYEKFPGEINFWNNTDHDSFVRNQARIRSFLWNEPAP